MPLAGPRKSGAFFVESGGVRRFRLYWWEGVLLSLSGALALVFLIAGDVLAGVVLFCLVALATAGRVQIPERNVAGGYARTRSYLLAAQWLSLFSIYGVCLYLSWLMWLDHWTRDFHGKVAFWLLIGFGFFLVRETRRIGDRANDWWWGAEMEREVARRLEPLRDEGWMVAHDIPREGGGNVDHFVSGPSGAFAIETKRGRNRAASRNQAVSGAVWAREKFGERRWVTGILCVGTDPPAKPIKQGHVWILGVDDLAGFVRRPVDFTRRA